MNTDIYHGGTIKKSICIITALVLAATVFVIPVSGFAGSSKKQPQEFANVILFAHFSGDENGAAFFADAENRSKIMNIYDGTHGRSFTNYLKQISYDQFHVKNIFPQDDGTKITSCQLDITAAQAQSGNCDTEIISKLLSEVPDLGNIVVDYDNDGFIDNLTVVLRGDADSGATGSSLIPHKSDYPDPDATWSGKHIGTYNILDSSGLVEETYAKESGLAVHEFLHTLGYPDLYPSGGSSLPVYTWDIMGSVSPYLQYPLAYLRMHFSHWIDIETVTSSRTGLTLHTQDNADGNQAFILKSPLNDREVFVVEFRKKANATEQYLSEDTLDAKIGGTGIIVYRVDTTVEQLSNHFGQTGIYIFRPQPGQTGYDADEKLCIQNAFLSTESGRTSIGSADFTKTLEDGALTYSDGSNSGIVISNVSTSSGDSMTLDVSIPDAASLDTWTDTGFPDDGDLYGTKNTALATDGSVQYLMSCSAGKFTAYHYVNDQWVQMGASFTENSTPVSMQMLVHNGQIYLGYDIPSSQKFVLKKYDAASKTWQTTATLDSIGGFDIKMANGSIHVATASGDSKSANLYQLNGSALKLLGTYFNSNHGYCGQPKLTAIGDTIYTSARNADGDKIQIFRYSNGTFTEVSDGSIASNTYDMESLGSKLYVIAGNENGKMNMFSYDGSKWTAGSSSDMDFYDPILVSSRDDLYVLTSSPTGDGDTKVFCYKPDSNTYVQEGINVDSEAGCLTMSSTDSHLYVSYVLDSGNRIKVKSKMTAEAQVNPDYTPEPTPDPGPTPAPEQDKDVTIPAVTKPPAVAAQKTVTANLYGGHDDFLIKWSGQNVSNATVRYLVQYQRYGKGWSTLSNGTTATSIRKKNLADGSRYRFKVTPYVTVSGKTYTGVSKTTAYVYTLKKVSKPKVKKKSRKYIKVSWTNIPGETGYQIARSTKKSKGYKIIKTVNYKKKTTNIKTKRKKKYYYKIRAYKTVDGKKIYGPWSSPRTYRLR